MEIRVNKSKQGIQKKIPIDQRFVVIGSDHGGYEAKKRLAAALAKVGYTVLDVGSFHPESLDDFPDFAVEVATAVAQDRTKKTVGILICSSGTGMIMAANKVKGIRAAFAFDKHSAIMGRHDNDANVLCLRGLNFPLEKHLMLARLFLTTPFSGIPRHKRRIRKIMMIEKDQGKSLMKRKR